jgi:hypothetical protein
MNAPFLGPTPAAKPPKLLEQVKRCIRDKHYSLRTEEVFVYWARLSHDIDSGPNDRLRLSCARHECWQLADCVEKVVGQHPVFALMTKTNLRDKKSRQIRVELIGLSTQSGAYCPD